MEHAKSRFNLLPLISLFAAIGAAISIWQTRLYYVTRSGMGEMNSFCNIGDRFDCTAIEMSKYSEFIGGMPLSAFAIAGYLMILVLSLLAMSSSMQRNARKVLLVFTGIAVLFSVAYFAIMMQIGKLCLFCLIVDAINLILLVLALKLPKNNDAEGDLSFSYIAGTGAAALFVSFLFMKGLDPQGEMRREDLNDIVESVMNTPITNVQLPSDAPFVGEANAPITIAKFSDYECPACKMGATAIHPLFKRYPKEVKFVFVNFPLAKECNPDPQLKRTMHEFACEAAAVAVCAQEQGKFLEAYETLFENQRAFQHGKIADVVLEHISGLDGAKLKACMTLPSTSERIKNDAKTGMNLKVQSTPTFFINGRKIEGGLPTSLWIEIIDRHLKK